MLYEVITSFVKRKSPARGPSDILAISIFAFGGLTKAIGVVINAAERLVSYNFV